MIIRDSVKKDDIKNIKEIVESTGYFNKEEIDIAIELVEDKLNNSKSTYQFKFLEIENKVIAYSCFGLIPCSKISYDLYWIVVHNNFRGKGYGKYLIKETENFIKNIGGYQIIVETSSKEQYKPTRDFYIKSGYKELVVYKDFYDYRDNKIVYYKIL